MKKYLRSHNIKWLWSKLAYNSWLNFDLSNRVWDDTASKLDLRCEGWFEDGAI